MRHLFLCCSLLVTFFTSHAQQYKWVTGGGSPSSMDLSAYSEQVRSMCTDANGNVYITSYVGDAAIKTDTFYMAHSYDTGLGEYPHILIASYNCEGHVRWAKLLDAKWGAYADGLSYDSFNGIYCSGELLNVEKHIGNDTIINSPYLTEFVAAFDTSGKFRWVRFVGADDKATGHGTTQENFDCITRLVVDGNYHIHYYPYVLNGVQITSSLTSNRGTYDLEYDTAGNLLNATQLLTDSMADVVNVIFNKKSTSAYAIMRSIDDSTGGDKYWYLAAYNSTDSMLWSDTTGESSAFGGICYDGFGDIYASGEGDRGYFSLNRDTFVNPYTFDNISVMLKLDTAGNIKWVFDFYGNTGVNFLNDLAILSNNQIAGFGIMAEKIRHGNDSIIDPNPGQTPLFVIVDSSGKLIKLDQLHADGGYDWGTAITSDKNNNIYIGGRVSDSIYAGNGRAYHTNGGNTDFFIAKYGYSCNCTTVEEPTPMFAITSDSVHESEVVNFTYTGSLTPDSIRWNFGDGTISTTTNPTHTFTDTGVYKVCLTTYACDSGIYCQTIRVLPPTGVASLNTFGNVRVFPNPMSGQLFIENAENGDKVKLYDIMGREMYVGIINNQKYFIDTRDLGVGTYLLELTDSYRRRNSTTVVKQ